MKTLLKWLSTNQKSIAISIFVTLVLLLVWNLWTMINHLDTSYMYTHSLESNSTDTLDMAQQWAMRGQMGDILSGHFSALAFLAVALSVFLQNEANRQMKLSLVQQSKALEVQSESLKAQIEELQQSRKESERQTEEFFIANMNVKLDRYYKMLDYEIEKIEKTELIKNYVDNKALLEMNEGEGNLYSHLLVVNNNAKSEFEESSLQIKLFLMIIAHIYTEIENLKEDYPNAYQNFMDELKVKTLSTNVINELNTHLDDASKQNCTIFKFFQE